MKLPCEQSGCKRSAIFKVWRADRIAPRIFCANHLAVKVGKYELRVERLK